MVIDHNEWGRRSRIDGFLKVLLNIHSSAVPRKFVIGEIRLFTSEGSSSGGVDTGRVNVQFIYVLEGES